MGMVKVNDTRGRGRTQEGRGWEGHCHYKVDTMLVYELSKSLKQVIIVRSQSQDTLNKFVMFPHPKKISSNQV